MDPLASVALPRLMSHTSGRRGVRVGLVDGRVDADHRELADASMVFLHEDDGLLSQADGEGAIHATSVAGVLVARRGSGAPAICPGATLLIRSVFSDTASQGPATATFDELASAIVELADAGARIIDMSLAVDRQTVPEHRALQEALDHVHRSGAIIVAAAGNQNTVAGSFLTRHSSVVPVVGYDFHGKPSDHCNFGHSIGRRGIGAPAVGISSLAPAGGSRPFGGTSVAAAVVTGAIALLCSEFPEASPAEVKFALRRSKGSRVSVIPPLLDAWLAFETLQVIRSDRGYRNG
ncbi:S8 family peptidase [Nocardia sp. NPDC001965]